MKKPKHENTYVGGSHSSGQDVSVTIKSHDGKKIDTVRTEGGEMYLCGTVLEDKAIYEFKDKTNAEIIHALFKENECTFDQNLAHPGDFVVRKTAVDDPKKRDRKGTAKEIVNEIQSEKQGRLAYARGRKLKKGGKIKPIKEYSEKELKARLEKKIDGVATLSKNIRSLKTKVSKDLKSDNEKEKLVALAVALMLKTSERIGNEHSAGTTQKIDTEFAKKGDKKDAHFGITTLRKKHVKVKGDKVELEYVGKSGVDHDKEFTDHAIAKTLKWAIGNTPTRNIFTTSKGLKIKATQVNRFLSEYGISAKDIRGFSANKLIVEGLKARDIPKDEADRKKIFIEILKRVAKKIGHGRATLKTHYLLPEIEEQYIVKGKIHDIKKLEDGGEIEEKAKGGKIKAADVTKLPRFKKWFDGSKVVDEYGKPLIVYHGSADVINIFDSRYGGDTTGNNDYGVFFFTDNERVAIDYSRHAYIRRNEGDYYDADKTDELYVDAEENIKVIPAYLQIKNPLVINWEGEVIDTIKSQEYINFAKNGVYAELVEEIINDLKYYTKDGIKAEKLLPLLQKTHAYGYEKIKSLYNNK